MSDSDEESERYSRRRRAAARELKDLMEDQETFSKTREPRRNNGLSSTISEQEQRQRAPRSRGLVAAYDDRGIHINSGKDLCDCLDLKCPGCFFPCKSCGSNKCGRKCRCERKWMYTQVVEQNPFEESTVLRTKPV